MTEDDLDCASGCPDWSNRELVNHLVGSTVAVRQDRFENFKKRKEIVQAKKKPAEVAGFDRTGL